ncbi:hypothetical protein NUW54_g11417 [Trametes sanguinea]|uniref:Uncharacterized protein n=1 Tax=Trametes sanguinea TaxID=158606 RepID=A0ACC1NEJ5_9APHY|nr:hypothetical protein NUW54_g11417 [Trametes sanguinea]
MPSSSSVSVPFSLPSTLEWLKVGDEKEELSDVLVEARLSVLTCSATFSDSFFGTPARRDLPGRRSISARMIAASLASRQFVAQPLSLLNSCFNAPFPFWTVIVKQPSNEGLPFQVRVGPDCDELYALPAVNICFQVFPPLFNVFDRT